MRARTDKPGRSQRTAGALIAAAGLLFTAVCVASAWWWWGYCAQTWLADFGDGTLYTRRFAPNTGDHSPYGWRGGPNGGSGTGRTWTWTWWACGEYDMPREKLTAFSVWPLGPGLLAVGGALYVHGRRTLLRVARNQCLRCGYPRAGLAPTAACPECGEISLGRKASYNAIKAESAK